VNSEQTSVKNIRAISLKDFSPLLELDADHRFITKMPQIQHPGLDVPCQYDDLEVDLICTQESGRYMRQSKAVLEVFDQIFMLRPPLGLVHHRRVGILEIVGDDDMITVFTIDR
jgi:hypothetical protein